MPASTDRLQTSHHPRTLATPRQQAYAAPPVNEAAQALYSAVETHLQLTGGMLGVKPIGHDRYDRPRTLMQWADITRLLLHHMPDLARLYTADDLYADLIRLSEKVETATTHAGERRLVGVCPNCLNTKGDDDEPIRTRSTPPAPRGIRCAPNAAHGST